MISMETYYERYSHISLQIFEQLDDESLNNCREVSKSWKDYIDDNNMQWLCIINIPKFQIGDTYLHTGKSNFQFKISLDDTWIKESLSCVLSNPN